MPDSTSSRRSKTLGYELVERSTTLGWVGWPELVRPVAHLSSPIMRPRLVRPLPPDPDRMTFVIPPVRDVIGPMAWGMAAGVAILALVGWQAAILGAVVATIYRAVDQRMSRLDFNFADGFLGFRTTTELPHGVREDNDVRWNWSPTPPGQGAQG
jgi:hypothetical protein